MVQKFARIAGFARLIAVAVAAFLIATSGSSAVGGLASVAYQTPVATTASISNAPNFPFGSCVPVRVTIASDAGTPHGTVQFSVDGVVVDTRAVPSSGSFTEMIGCCGSRISTPLSVGTHHFAVTFIPNGNWAPSHATGQVVILPASNGSTAAPVCGGTPTPGVHGVDAGLSTFGGHAGGTSPDVIGIAVSGMALALAAGVIAAYRRRRAAPSAPGCD